MEHGIRPLGTYSTYGVAAVELNLHLRITSAKHQTHPSTWTCSTHLRALFFLWHVDWPVYGSWNFGAGNRARATPSTFIGLWVQVVGGNILHCWILETPWLRAQCIMLKWLNMGRGLRHMKQKSTQLVLIASAMLMGRSPRTMSDIGSNSKGIRRIWAREIWLEGLIGKNGKACCSGKPWCQEEH